MPSLHEPGKPHIFILEPSERETENAARYTDDPRALSEYALLVAAVVQVIEARSIDAGALSSLESAFRSTHKVVWDAASRYFTLLSHYFPPVLDHFVGLFSDRSAQIRLRVVQAQWSSQLPEPHLTSLLRRALHDRAPRVRAFAADRIEQFELIELLPDLEHRLREESHQGTREALEHAQNALRALA